MNKSNLEKILVDELQYSNYEASLTANDLMQLQPQLIPAVEKWGTDRTETDINIMGFSAKQLMKSKHFTYPAALIALDWLLTEPEIAKKELGSDIVRK